ncbi:dnaJ (Hsp40) homolog, subfamily C, member 30b [Genypterus blacodes]|uniref:dnaJ (Hsp40) homolog, subfamily C, member 30b n=1 Tax=Genypterus blacodes TaxID=154954 RepID=UPI003F764DDA
MAEVGQRLNGICRLSALRNGRSRPACAGEDSGSLPGLSAFTDSWLRAETAANLRQCPLRHGAKHDTLEKVCRGRESEDGSSCCFTCMDSDCCYSDGAVESREQLLRVRMASWSRRGTSVTFDLRTEPGSRRSRRRLLKVCPDALWSSSTIRYYSEDAPLLHRSRTGYYDLLKVSPAATQAQIKTAYYKQSFIYHPDKNPGSKEATQRFSEISEAYTVLGNVDLRRKYDRGILSQSQVQGAGRPSSKPAPATKQQHQHGERRFTQSGGKPMFDFDAFYQGHYGEQLQREQIMRARRRYFEEQQKKKYKQRMGEMVRATAVILLGLAGSVLFICSRA